MKRLLTLILLLNFQFAIACKCSMPPLMERIASADFVATAKIINIYSDEDNSEYHTIEIAIIDLYKGLNNSQLKIHSHFNSSCKFYTPQNSTWLIFADKNKHGVLSFGFCSGSKQLDKKFDSDLYPNANTKYRRSIDLKLQVLNYLKNKEIEPTNEFELNIHLSNKYSESLKDVVVTKQRFAIYELSINKDLSIEKIRPIKEFDNENSSIDIFQFIKNGLMINTFPQRETIATETKIILGLYYYPPEKNDKSFVSIYDL